MQLIPLLLSTQYKYIDSILSVSQLISIDKQCFCKFVYLLCFLITAKTYKYVVKSITLHTHTQTHAHNYIIDNEDRWKKIGVPKYQKPLTSYHAIIFHMRILFWGFLVLWHPNFFSPILIIIDIMLKFRTTAHLECFKYPYWYIMKTLFSLFGVTIWRWRGIPFGGCYKLGRWVC